MDKATGSPLRQASVPSDEVEVRPSRAAFLRSLLLDGAKLAIPGFYLPLRTLIEHYGYVTRDYRLLVLALGTTGLTVLSAVGAQRMGLSRASSVNVGVVIGLTLAFGGRLAVALPGSTWAVLVLLATGVALIIKLSRFRLIDYVVTWLTLVLWLWIGLTLIQTWISADELILSTADPAVVDLDEPEGDVVVVILDEYPNADIIARTLDLDMDGFVASMVDSGFHVDASLPASYAFTEFAIPAFLMLDLPALAGDVLSESSRRELQAVSGGRNAMFEAFEREGYRTTVVESGWSGLRCMENVDRCVVRSWYDEVTASVLESSLIGGLLADRLGSPFTLGSERVMAWIRNELPAVGRDEQDDLVIVHVMLPHTPIAFNASCAKGDPSPDLAVDGLAAQVLCANEVIELVSAATQDGLVTVVMGDHGSKLLGQTQLPPDHWTKEMIAERMRTLVAVRGLADCDEPLPRSTANVSVHLMRCLGADIAYLPDVAYATSVHGDPLVDVYPP